MYTARNHRRPKNVAINFVHCKRRRSVLFTYIIIIYRDIFGPPMQKRVSCGKSAVGLLPCCHQADIRMRSHHLFRLHDNKFAASCRETWCKLIVKIFCPQAWCKAARLQIHVCQLYQVLIISNFHRPDSVSWRSTGLVRLDDKLASSQ